MATPLSSAQINEQLAGLPGWEHSNGVIAKTYNVDSYMAGLAMAAAVGTVCEGLNHHPDIHIGYKKVTVSFTTHDAGNIVTENDVEAAAAVERLGYPRP